jgi:hypothetical protein
MSRIVRHGIHLERMVDGRDGRSPGLGSHHAHHPPSVGIRDDGPEGRRDRARAHQGRRRALSRRLQPIAPRLSARFHRRSSLRATDACDSRRVTLGHALSQPSEGGGGSNLPRPDRAPPRQPSSRRFFYRLACAREGSEICIGITSCAINRKQVDSGLRSRTLPEAQQFLRDVGPAAPESARATWVVGRSLPVTRP